MAAPPPPPPPPAPPPPSVPATPVKLEPGGIVIDDVLVTHYMCVGQCGVDEHRQQCQREQKDSHDKDTIFLSFYRTVVPVIQSGPLCGLVAVAMAAPLVGAQDVSTEKLLERAIHEGYTKQGEMFSASNMCCLVQSVMPTPYHSEVLSDCKEVQMLEYLLQGDLFLIPYDADKNHSPCQKKGHKAHWMLITGCFLAVNNAERLIDVTLLEEFKDYYEQSLYHLKPENPMTPDLLKAVHQNMDRVTCVFVYGHQGKSRHTGVWTVLQLLASNAQLTELGPARTTDMYIVPEGGLEQGLCGQVVRIFRSDPV